jgi:hypothetical protein
MIRNLPQTSCARSSCFPLENDADRSYPLSRIAFLIPVKRETRINLLFLTLFLAISLPGAVILFKKKLAPGAARMDQPDAIVRQLPYMAPIPVPPGVKWIVPPRTRQWLENLNRRFGNGDLLSASDDPQRWQPVISDDHVVQEVSVGQSSTGVTISLLIWDPSLESDSADYSFTAKVDGQSVPARIQSSQPVAVPDEMKRELMSLNLIRPPAKVIWIEVVIDGMDQNPKLEQLRMDYHGPGVPRQSVVKLP